MKLAYIDPQSYNNLSKYDVSFLQSIDRSIVTGGIRFFCSSNLDRSPPADISVDPVFRYNKKRTAVGKLLSYIRSVVTILIGAINQPAMVYHLQWIKFAPVDLIFIFLLRLITRGSVVLTVHNIVPHGREGHSHRTLGLIYRMVDRVLVHDNFSGEEIAERFAVPRSRISTIAHGLITLEPKGIASHKSRIDRFVKRVSICFLFLGSGSFYKGLDILVSAWKVVAPRFGNKAGLIILGRIDGALSCEIGEAAASNPDTLLVIDEFLSEADLHHAVEACDAVILPHRQISQSGVLLSVLGLQVPVIVSDRPGLLEPLSIADIGWSFDGTEGGLVRVLSSLIDNQAEIHLKRNNKVGWALVLERYAWSGIGQVASAIYLDVAKV